MKKTMEELGFSIVLLKVREAGKQVKKFNELKSSIITEFGISEETLDKEIRDSSPALHDPYILRKLLGYIDRLAYDKDDMFKHINDCLGIYDELFGPEKQDTIRLFIETCDMVNNFIKLNTKPVSKFSVN